MAQETTTLLEPSPQRGVPALPSIERDGARGAANGALRALPATVRVRQDTLVSGRAASLIDSGEAHVETVRELRASRLQELSAVGQLSKAFAHLLAQMAAPERTTVLSAIPDASALQAIIQRLSLRSSKTAPTQTSLTPITPEEAQARPDSKRAKKTTLTPDEEEEDSPAPPSQPRTLVRELLDRLGTSAREFIRAVGSLVGRGIAAVQRLLENRANTPGQQSSAGPLAPHHSIPDTTLTVTPAGRIELPEAWSKRFEDDPAEVKQAINDVARVLEDFARGEAEKEEREIRKTQEEEASRAEKMEQLRDKLARILLPLGNGEIPLLVLSEHFQSMWLTDDDLLAAITRVNKNGPPPLGRA